VNFDGRVSIQAPRERVWAFLTDPQKVASCAPGLDSLDVLEPGKKFRAKTAIGFGAVKVKFVNDVEWTELDPPHRAAMKAHGTAPGSAVDATTSMELSDGANGGTDLAWTADVNVVGTIASMAMRLMGGVTKTLTNAFFDRVREEIEKGA
jgi:carbon monoxide dehydrogenase subunit G